MTFSFLRIFAFADRLILIYRIVIADITMKELRQLDVGYGYTADNGETYPFRSQYNWL